MVNPTEDMKANYEILLKVFEELSVKLQHGRQEMEYFLVGG